MQYLLNKVRLCLKWRPQSVLDVIARLPGCDGQAADAISAHAQVKLEDAPRMLKIPRSDCPEVRMCLPRHKWPKSWSNIEDLVVLLERYLYGHPLAGLLWERQFEGVLFGLGWRKSTELGMSVCASKNKDSCRYSWMTSKWLDDSRMWLPCGRNWWNLSILENRRHFLTMYIWDALNVNVSRTKIIVEYREMFESRFSAGATEKNYQDGRNLTQKRLRGLTTWKDMLESAWKDTVSWRTKRSSSCTNRVQNPENSQECQKYVNTVFKFWETSAGLCVCASAQAQGDLCEGSRTNQLARKKLGCHDMQISDNQDLEKVFTNIRQKLNRSENEKILDQKVNVLIWW